MIPSSLIRFLFVGLLNTALGYSIILILSVACSVEPFTANMTGYVAGGLLSYQLNRRYTFDSQQRHWVTMPRFMIAWVGCYLLNVLVLSLCLNNLGWSVTLSQTIAVGVYTCAFYLLNRMLVFRHRQHNGTSEST